MISAMSLKARIRNLSKSTNTPAQVILQNFMFERFLQRLSLSRYKDNYLIKGGFLIESMLGIGNRTTMDLDTTINKMVLNEKTIMTSLEEIFKIDCNDGVNFKILNIGLIHEDDYYGGFRVQIVSIIDKIKVIFSIDFTTGDKITPYPIKRIFTGLIDKEVSYELWTYNNETILAEKIETILRRSVLNTRIRDYYDVYMLIRTNQYDKKVFFEAFQVTSEHRKSLYIMKNINSILDNIMYSNSLIDLWKKYQKTFSYSKNIDFKDIVITIKEFLC